MGTSPFWEGVPRKGVPLSSHFPTQAVLEGVPRRGTPLLSHFPMQAVLEGVPRWGTPLLFQSILPHPLGIQPHTLSHMPWESLEGKETQNQMGRVRMHRFRTFAHAHPHIPLPLFLGHSHMHIFASPCMRAPPQVSHTAVQTPKMRATHGQILPSACHAKAGTDKEYMTKKR